MKHNFWVIYLLKRQLKINNVDTYQFVNEKWEINKFFYHIYLINHPEHLLNFSTLRAGAYLRPPLSASVICLFCNKTINGNNKMRRCNKVRFLLCPRRKLCLRGSVSLGGGRGWGGAGWVLIRGWVLINFFCLQDGCLFEVGATSRSGAF